MRLCDLSGALPDHRWDFATFRPRPRFPWGRIVLLALACLGFCVLVGGCLSSAPAPEPAPVVEAAAPEPCNCFVTGECSCDPGTCDCAKCVKHGVDAEALQTDLLWTGKGLRTHLSDSSQKLATLLFQAFYALQACCEAPGTQAAVDATPEPSGASETLCACSEGKPCVCDVVCLCSDCRCKLCPGEDYFYERAGKPVCRCPVYCELHPDGPVGTIKANNWPKPSETAKPAAPPMPETNYSEIPNSSLPETDHHEPQTEPQTTDYAIWRQSILNSGRFPRLLYWSTEGCVPCATLETDEFPKLDPSFTVGESDRSVIQRMPDDPELRREFGVKEVPWFSRIERGKITCRVYPSRKGQALGWKDIVACAYGSADVFRQPQAEPLTRQPLRYLEPQLPYYFDAQAARPTPWVFGGGIQNCGPSG